ncbi:MAG: RsmE family RNA methyltransferase [Gemmatimonadales bacterium]
MVAVLVPAGTLQEQSTAELEEEEQHHLRVRRASEGQTVRVLDGAGALADGKLVRQGKSFTVAVGSVTHRPKPAPFLLAVGAGDRDRFAWLAEKAAELGVTDLVPLVTERTQSVAAGLRESHIPALQRRARQAIKQSLTAWCPVIHQPRPVAEVAAGAQESFRWLGDMNGDPPPAIPPDAALTVVVGPEGGLTPAERLVLLEAGFTPVRLAPDLLRFETAALAAAAVVASQRPRRPL